MVLVQRYLFLMKDFLLIHAGIEVHLILGIHYRSSTDEVIHDFVLHLFPGIIELRVIHHPYRRCSFYHPHVAMYLRRHVVTVYP